MALFASLDSSFLHLYRLFGLLFPSYDTHKVVVHSHTQGKHLVILSDYCFRLMTHIKSLYRAIYIKTMFCSSLAPLVCRRVRVLLMLFVFIANIGVQHVLIIWVTCRMYYKRQDLLIPREYLSSSLFVERSLSLIFLGFFVLSYYMCLWVLCSVTISA